MRSLIKKTWLEVDAVLDMQVGWLYCRSIHPAG